MVRPAWYSLVLVLWALGVGSPANGQKAVDSSAQLNLQRYRFTQIRQMRVEDSNGEPLARVDNLILDRRVGKVRYSLLSIGGHLGLGRSHKLAPAPALSMETAKKGVVALPLTRQQVQALPEFRRQDLPRLENPGYQLALLEVYGFSQPVPAQWDSTSTTPNRHDLVLATELLGKSVDTSDDHRLGVISDLLVDLSGQKPVLVICSRQALFKRGARYAVMLNALTPGERGSQVLKASVGPPENAPWLSIADWQRAATRPQVFLFKYDDTQHGEPREQADNAQSDHPNPAAPSQAVSDLHLTARIRKAVSSNANLSFTAKNINIMTANGRVTLSGRVGSPAEKQVIEQIAAQAAGSSNVLSRIETPRK